MNRIYCSECFTTKLGPDGKCSACALKLPHAHVFNIHKPGRKATAFRPAKQGYDICACGVSEPYFRAEQEERVREIGAGAVVQP